jgi:hypothetical protein
MAYQFMQSNRKLRSLCHQMQVLIMHHRMKSSYNIANILFCFIFYNVCDILILSIILRSLIPLYGSDAYEHEQLNALQVRRARG